MPHWVCEVCQREITEGEDGSILVFNVNPALGPVGGHPVGPTSEPPDLDSLVLPTQEAWDYFRALHERVGTGFSVAHRECQPDESEGPYSIDTAHAPTMEAWAAWVIHLAGKSWMGREDIVDMLAFWWTHKGQHPRLDEA